MRDQDVVLRELQHATFISVFDAVAFYYQWGIHPSCTWIFTARTPFGQYTFKCAVMGDKGSNAYVQRQMEAILDGTIAKSYCDDIIAATLAWPYSAEW